MDKSLSKERQPDKDLPALRNSDISAMLNELYDMYTMSSRRPKSLPSEIAISHFSCSSEGNLPATIRLSTFNPFGVPNAWDNDKHASEDAWPLPSNSQPCFDDIDDKACALESDVRYPKAWKRTAIMIALCLAVFCMALDNTILATAIPKITDEFHALDDVAWYASSYLLTTCAFQLFFGRLYSFYTSRVVFLSAVALFEAGSLLSGVAPTSLILIVCNPSFDDRH